MKSKGLIIICPSAIIGIFFIIFSCKPLEEFPDKLNTILPEKLIVAPDKYMEEMDATKGWTLLNGVSLELNSAEVHSGSGSIKLTSGVGVNAQMEKVVDWNFSSDQGESFRIWIFPHSDPAITIGSIMVYLYKNDGYTEYAYISYSGELLLSQNKWTMLWKDPKIGSGWHLYGGYDMSVVHKIKILQITKSGQSSICSYDLISEGQARKSTLMISFDDNNLSQYTLAYPLIKAKGMVASCYIISDCINASDKLTSTQMQELYATGWDICNHSKTHSHLDSMTQQQVEEDELEACKMALDYLGLTRASKHVAYPYGEYDGNIIAAMDHWGAKSGRIVTSAYNLYEQGVYNLGFPFKINAIVIRNTTKLADAKSYIDLALTLNVSVTLLFHNFVEANPGEFDWLIADFSELLDYIESLDLQTLTIDEYYRLYSGPITVNHK